MEHGGKRHKALARANMLKSIQDLSIFAVLLISKLVAWKAQHCQGLRELEKGNGRKENVSVTFAHNSFICAKSLVVVPHRVAVFSTRTTFPLNSSMEIILLSSSLAASNW